MENSRRAYTTIQEEHKREKAERRGVGFVGFLSDLDWMLSLELEEGRPLDETKITTAQKFSSFNQGMAFGISLHSAVLFFVSIAFYSLLWSFKIENDILIHLVWLGSVLFSLAIKIAIPLWLIEDYYIFPRGITYTYLSWFLLGYSIGLFIPEFFYVLLISLFMGIYFVMKSAITSDWWIKAVQIIEKYLPHYADFKWLPVHIFLLTLSFSPYWLLKRYKKKHPMQKYEWMPLDFVPEDENFEKQKR